MSAVSAPPAVGPLALGHALDGALDDDAAHLLVVDDDSRIRTLLARYLAGQGFRVTTAGNAGEARKKLLGMAFDLIVLDVMMPGESGLAFAAWLQSQPGPVAPILMLTARAAPAERIEGLEAGADDYLAKPFEPRELCLRVKSILRRLQPSRARRDNGGVVRFGRFCFHLERSELRRDGLAYRLTERERAILRSLALARGAPVSRLRLAGDSAEERTIDVQITRLRRKIEEDAANPVWLQTVRGAGYRLALEAADTLDAPL